MKLVSRLTIAAALAISGISLAQAAAPMEPLAPTAKAFLETRNARLEAKVSPSPLPSTSVLAPAVIKLDIDAPVLTAIGLLTPEVDASKPGAQIRFKIAAADEYSGVFRIELELRRDVDGGWLKIDHVIGYPTKSFDGKIAIDLGDDNSAGTWEANSLTISDLAGNVRSFDKTQLQGLGVPAALVVAGRATDFQPPEVVGGKLITPTISLSGYQKGTLTNQMVAGFNVQAQDTSAGKVSGVKSATATFCDLAKSKKCFGTAASETASGQAKRTLRTIYFDYYYLGLYEPGVYKLTTLSVTDFAANTRTYTSKEEGGDTDFNVMFPEGAAISLVP